VINIFLVFFLLVIANYGASSHSVALFLDARISLSCDSAPRASDRRPSSRLRRFLFFFGMSSLLKCVRNVLLDHAWCWPGCSCRWLFLVFLQPARPLRLLLSGALRTVGKWFRFLYVLPHGSPPPPFALPALPPWLPLRSADKCLSLTLSPGFSTILRLSPSPTPRVLKRAGALFYFRGRRPRPSLSYSSPRSKNRSGEDFCPDSPTLSISNIPGFSLPRFRTNLLTECPRVFEVDQVKGSETPA